MDDEGSDRFRYTKPYREVAAYLNTVKLLVSQGRYKISERERIRTCRSCASTTFWATVGDARR